MLDVRFWVAAVVFLLVPAARAEPVGTAFTFQSVLTDAGSPVDGPVDLRLSLWDAAVAGNPVGSTLTESTTASEGRVTVTPDFGATPFDQDAALWLQVEISLDAGGSYTTIGRQRLTPTPFAINAQRSDSTRGITVLPDGKVGIGTATPAYRFTIDQPGPGFSHTWDAGGADITTFVNGSGGWIGTVANKPLFLYTNDSAPRVTLDTLGNMGIGTQSPTARLDVRDFGLDGTGLSVQQTGVGNTIGVDSVVTGGVGVRGESETDIGVLGVTSQLGTGWGVFSQGRIGASGTKSFVIDHPLDPGNKVLLHYSTETPQPENRYSGTVVLDASGRSVVVLPEYFEAINSEFRYQLTAIGGAAPSLHVASEVSNNRFVVAGGSAGLKVSWEVTAKRTDAFVQLKGSPRELLKAPENRGKYLLPEAYNAPAGKGLHAVERVSEK